MATIRGTLPNVSCNLKLKGKIFFIHFFKYFNRNEKDLKEILKDHKQCILNEETNYIIVRRSRIVQTAFTAIQAKSFNCRKQLSVKFSGEKGSDAGGPQREFFRHGVGYTFI